MWLQRGEMRKHVDYVLQKYAFFNIISRYSTSWWVAAEAPGKSSCIVLETCIAMETLCGTARGVAHVESIPAQLV